MIWAVTSFQKIRSKIVVGMVLAAAAAAPTQAEQLAMGTSAPQINVTVAGGNDRSHDSRGTGFLVGRDTWVTAAHVVNGCAAVYVKVGNEWRPASHVRLHGSADLAVFHARQDERTRPLPISTRAPVAGDVAIHVGFAKGEFTAVETRLSAAANVRLASTGAMSAGWVWTQEQAGADRRMNGVSGGPQLDARGAVQGVTISYGNGSGGLRMTTASISDLQGFLPASLQRGQTQALSGGFEGFAGGRGSNPHHLRVNGSVTSVFCATTTSTPNLPQS
jgi:S1-C subfamily serine protease